MFYYISDLVLFSEWLEETKGWGREALSLTDKKNENEF